eukprot:GHVO01032188.1.p1 GENE.GHVO01032188.1~~GHVO01032188.1.p1  ORF type:complete len:248 (+),score=42.79 GHVO01032188.1:351-1094(+)
MFKVDDRVVRITYDQHEVPIAAIRKERIHQFDVFTGRDRNEDFSTELMGVDMRISLNIEYNENAKEMHERVNNMKHEHARQRTRTSIIIGDLFQFDMTRVKKGSAAPGAASTGDETLEFEVELNPNAVLPLLDDDGKFKALVKLFVDTMRACCVFLNSSNAKSEALQKVNCDLTKCLVSDETLAKYLKYVSPVVPIIGDYLFRAVAQDRAAANEAPLTETDIKESIATDVSEQIRVKIDEMTDPTNF